MGVQTSFYHRSQILKVELNLKKKSIWIYYYYYFLFWHQIPKQTIWVIKLQKCTHSSKKDYIEEIEERNLRKEVG